MEEIISYVFPPRNNHILSILFGLLAKEIIGVNMFQEILYHVLKSLYQFTGAALLIAFLSMFFLLHIEKEGFKKSVGYLFKKLKEEKIFRSYFEFLFVLSMILFRTVLCRNIWNNPLSNIVGNWGLYDGNGALYTENIENTLLFIPLLYLYIRIKRQREEECKILHSMLAALSFSLLIEMLQLFFKVGTFQLSDLFFNTFGGLIGALIDKGVYNLIKKHNGYKTRE